MAKGWKIVYTNVNASTGNKSDFKAFDKLIRNTPRLSLYELKKEGIELYEKKIAEKNKLIEAGRGTKLKPEQIKAARAKTKKKEKVTASVAD